MGGGADETNVQMETYSNRCLSLEEIWSLCFLDIFPPHVHAKEGKKIAYVVGRVSGCEGMGAGIGWKSVLQETTGCESGWRELRWTHTKQSRRSKQQHARARQIHTSNSDYFFFFFLVCCENNFNPPLGISPWISFRERNSGREDNSSERMREWRKGIKGKRLKSLSCSRALLDLLSFVFYFFFYYTQSLWWLSGD